jgi:hypothetical protein
LSTQIVCVNVQYRGNGYNKNCDNKIIMKKNKTKKIQLRVTEQFWDDLTELTRIFKTSKSQYITEIVQENMCRQKELLKNVLTNKH